MNRNILKRIGCLLCITAILLSFAACSDEKGAKEVLLEDGWNVENAALNAEGLSLADTVLSGETTFSNKFDGAMDVASKEKIYLEMSDACGVESVSLNGKDITLSGLTDVTREYKKSGGNVLTVKANGDTVSPGSKVSFACRPEVNVKCVGTVLDMANGVSSVKVTVRNLTGKEHSAKLSLHLSSADNDAVAVTDCIDITAPDGESEWEFDVTAYDLREWNYASPYLYFASVTLEGSFGTDSYTDYVGFKDLSYDENGFLNVNGRQTLIKCAEISFNEALGENLLNTVNFVKTCGYNALTVYDGKATEALLDYCDRVGVMVIGEYEYSHVSLMPVYENELTDVNAENSADALNTLKKLGVGSIVRISASPLKENSADGESFAAWYDTSDACGTVAPGEMLTRSGRQDVNEIYRLASLARANDIAGIVIGGDASMKKYTYSDVVPDILNDVRFALNLNSTCLYNTDTLSADISLSNMGVLRKGTYTALINIVGENGGKAFGKEVEFEVKKDEHITQIAKVSVPLTDFKPGKYKITCELSFGGHPTCGEGYFTVYEKPAANIGGTVYAAGLTGDQDALLKECGVDVKAFNGSQNGTIVLGPKCTDASLFEKALDKAKGGAKVIVLNANAFEKLPDGIGLANQDNLFIPDNALTKGLYGAGSMITLADCGNVFTGKAIKGSCEISALSGYFIGDDLKPVSVSLCGRYNIGSGSVILSTLNFESKSPFTDNILINLLKNK